MTTAPKISDSDFQRLQEHVRLLHGLKRQAEDAPFRAKSSSRPTTTNTATATVSPCLTAVAEATGVDLAAQITTPRDDDANSVVSRLRTNKTYLFRRQCVQKRMHSLRLSDSLDVRELKRMHDLNLRPKHTDYFRLNKAFHMRWKNIRGLPVVHSHFRDTFLDTGKPPFVVPVHYKPFNVYWDADWAKQEFIFLDAAAVEEKKKDKMMKTEEKAASMPEPTTEPPLPRKKSDGERRSSSTSGQQPTASPPLQLPRKISSQLTELSAERRERESTGYEGFPQDAAVVSHG